MRVHWVEVYIPSMDVLESYIDTYDGQPFPRTEYRGEIINAIRSWGQTKLVVMLDTGTIREVNAELVKKAL